jgi:UDP-2,3-diacylglucosamine pyrophosphatase LpxH
VIFSWGEGEKVRSFTDKDGNIVNVSNEHLEKAVEIKIELQESSPSRKCNWKLHKKMMEEEKIHDSDTNESYRQLVKSYQKQIGRLASVEKYADLVSSSKLEAIKGAVGELFHEKRETQIIRNELNKVKRELSQTAIITEEIRNAFVDDIDWTFPNYVYEPKFTESKNKLILVIGDWHLGATVVDSKGNNYNYKIALDRIDKLKSEVINYIRLFNITEIIVANVGDTIEGLYMRNYNQPFETEFTLSEQISKATKLIVDLLVSLSAYSNVSYFGICGNHDRFFFEKNTVDSDNAMKIINESIKTIVELSSTKRITYIEVDNLFNYEKVFEVNGKMFKTVHGDFGKSSETIEKNSAIEQANIDCLIMGHWHHYKALEGNYGGWTIVNGSLMGRNNYSRKFKASANASQSIIVVTDSNIIPIKIDLQSS